MADYEDHRGSFDCLGSDGMTYTVEYIVHVTEQPARGGVALCDQGIELRCGWDTADRVGKGHYRFPNGVELRTDHPDAP